MKNKEKIEKRIRKTEKELNLELAGTLATEGYVAGTMAMRSYMASMTATAGYAASTWSTMVIVGGTWPTTDDCCQY